MLTLLNALRTGRGDFGHFAWFASNMIREKEFFISYKIKLPALAPRSVPAAFTRGHSIKRGTKIVVAVIALPVKSFQSAKFYASHLYLSTTFRGHWIDAQPGLFSA